MITCIRFFFFFNLKEISSRYSLSVPVRMLRMLRLIDPAPLSNGGHGIDHWNWFQWIPPTRLQSLATCWSQFRFFVCFFFQLRECWKDVNQLSLKKDRYSFFYINGCGKCSRSRSRWRNFQRNHLGSLFQCVRATLAASFIPVGLSLSNLSTIFGNQVGTSEQQMLTWM